MVPHGDRAGFDAVDHFADAAELRIREHLDFDAAVGAFLHQSGHFVGVAGLRRIRDADMGVAKLDLRLDRRRRQRDGRDDRESRMRLE